MAIRIIFGAPCSGKTSYIGAHARKGDIRVDWDKIAEAVDAKNTGTHVERDGAVKAATTYLRAVLNYYVTSGEWKARRDDDSEATAWIPVTRVDSIGGVDKMVAAGGRVTVLDPGEKECLRRCEEDGRPEGVADLIKEWYENDEAGKIPASWLYIEEKGDKPMRAKTIDVKVKATSGEKTDNPFGGELADGDFIAYASTFTTEPDSYGDTIEPGAFDRTLKEWAEKDAPIPLLYGHRMDDPAFNIGHIVDAKEDDEGLLVWGRIDLDSEKARQVYNLVKARRLTQLSFAYDVLDYDENQHGGWHLKDLDVHEVSLVQLGANRHTSVLAVKSAVDVVQTVKGDFTEDERNIIQDAAEAMREALDEIEKLLEVTQPEQDPEPDTAPNDTSTSGPVGGGENDREPEKSADHVSAKTAAAASLKLALAI